MTNIIFFDGLGYLGSLNFFSIETLYYIIIHVIHISASKTVLLVSSLFIELLFVGPVLLNALVLVNLTLYPLLVPIQYVFS